MDATSCTTDLSESLKADGWTVQLHTERYPGKGEKPDHEWIPEVAADGFAIITSDKKIQSWKTEDGKVRPVIEASKAKVFFIRGTPGEQAKALKKSAVAILRASKRHSGTAMTARIHITGSRLGEVQVLTPVDATKTERKYGMNVRVKNATDVVVD